MPDVAHQLRTALEHGLLQEVLQQLQAEGYPVDEAYFEYFSPSRYEHINRLGKYSFANPAQFDPLHRRPLRHSSDPMA